MAGADAGPARLLLLWASNGGGGVRNPYGEIDFAENLTGDRQEVNFYLHYRGRSRPSTTSWT